jgi:hypothetical protein
MMSVTELKKKFYIRRFLERTMMATMFPTSPKTEMAVKRTPSMMKPNVEVFSAAFSPRPC